MVNPALDPEQGREKPDPMKYPCQWIADEMSWPSNLTPTGGGRSRPVGGPALEHTLNKKDTIMLQLNIVHYGSWQHSGCQWHSRKPQGGRTPCLHSMGFTSHYCLQPSGLLGHESGKDAGFGLGIAGMCKGIRGQDRHSLEAARELQKCMPPLMTLNGGDIEEASLLRPAGEEPGPSPTLEEEASLLGKEDEPSEVSGPIPGHLGISRFVEPAEKITAPVTSTAPCLVSGPCSCPSLKGKKLWEKIDIDPNNPSQWVQAYMVRDNRLPEWWKEFHPLVCSSVV